MTDRIIRPELVPEWPPLIRPLISNLSQGLCNLASANNGDLLGVALYHEVSRGSIGSPLTEYACAFVGTGDGRSCDGALSSLAPQTRRHVDSLKQGILHNGRLARLLDLALSNAGTTFETIERTR